ncbi:MAG: hypothetical protein HY332_20035 [Chloroflexi bacterium]|nr:hypothetical protein [Chloroflexota bacterium]
MGLAVLRALSDDARWAAFEGTLNGHLVRVYDLRPERVHLDRTTASGHWAVTRDGLFQFGHSKDHRPDLPQVKVMLGALDPLGLPLTTEVLRGERADDRLYLPAIDRVRTSLGQRGLLYVGDCKMAALETRAGLQAGGDFYLCPLPAVQVSPAQWDAYLAPVEVRTLPLTPISRTRADGTTEVIAEGDEGTLARRATVDDAAGAQAIGRLGWRVYATNQPAPHLPLAQAALAYRDEYLVDRSLGRLKGAPVPLTPMYLARDDHPTGLIRLLTLAVVFEMSDLTPQEIDLWHAELRAAGTAASNPG